MIRAKQWLEEHAKGLMASGVIDLIRRRLASADFAAESKEAADAPARRRLLIDWADHEICRVAAAPDESNLSDTREC